MENTSPTPAEAGQEATDNETNTQSESQNSAAAEQMAFTEALAQVLKGERITKLEWANSEIFGYLNGGMLKIHNVDNVEDNWALSEADMIGMDYIVVQ